MSYIKKVTRAGRTLITEMHYSSRWNKKNIERGENCGKTTEAQEKCNERKTRRDLTVLLNANFCSDDYHLVLDYRPEERPATVEEAKENIRTFFRKMRRMYRKAGIVFQYVEACEFGKKGGLHHHLIIKGGVSTADIARKWPFGRSHFNQLDDTGEYSRLASYILKNRKYWKESGGTGKQYSRSRNMVIPQPKVTIVKTRNGFYEKPRERKGWRLAPYTEEHGVTGDGWPYMRYILVRDAGSALPGQRGYRGSQKRSLGGKTKGKSVTRDGKGG
ncbi:MAG: hypothetical protein K2J60_03595 [Acetatifactor sp.]|nr:hypothetical protein [Acetatifactor sp.]